MTSVLRGLSFFGRVWDDGYEVKELEVLGPG